MAGRQRTTFAKLQKERARQEKQAAKRARRQGLAPEPTVEYTPTADLNDPSTWKYADEIEAEKKAAAEQAEAAAADGEVTESGDASGSSDS
ncbi:MAG TPA: hypothetical protein VFW06_09245 [Acidimicrobiia bacterium]|nr:hypothetical protein [Acidimicrobiia bacterium]